MNSDGGWLSVSHFAQEKNAQSRISLINLVSYDLAGRLGDAGVREPGCSEVIRRINTLMDAEEEEFLEKFIIAEESYSDELQERASLQANAQRKTT